MWKEIQIGQGKTLYITDQEDIYADLRKEGRYVLPYYHEGNRGAVFPGAAYAVENWEELDQAYFERVYRRLAGLPWDILKTDRLLVRETVVEDADCFYRIYEEPSITAHMETLFEDRDEEIAYIKSYIETVYGFYDYGMWTVLERQSREVIGRAGISWREGYDLPELGFVIGVPWQGQGYAYEVCTAILDYARKELAMTKVQALVRPGNEKSVKLCKKLGFAYLTETLEGGVTYQVFLKEL